MLRIAQSLLTIVLASTFASGCSDVSHPPNKSAAAAALPPSGDNAPDGERGPVIDSPERFQDLNGVSWFYTTDNGIRFDSITSQLDDLKSRGIRIIGIYSPYHGKKWIGCGPVDYYATAPQSGTLDDFRALVKTAHVKGMKVVSYFANIYIDRDSAFFRKAEEQYRAGDRTSREVASFRWSVTADAPLPVPAAGPSAWKQSTVAGAYYWSLWDEAGFDFNLPGARAEIERVTRFWLDTGIDGFMWDAGKVDPRFKQAMVDLPTRYTTNDKWITFESAAAEDSPALDGFGLTSWHAASDDDAENSYSYVARGEDSAEELEMSFRGVDFARERGKTTFGWSILEGSYRDEATMRVQEAALMAGAGMLYGVAESDQPARWSPAVRAAWERVLVTVNANRALLPSASRRRVPAGTDPKAYAMVRTSKDGSQTALLVYNLKPVPASVPVDLGASGVGLAQTPKDLYAGTPMPAISGATYTLALPAHGFAMLEVTRL